MAHQIENNQFAFKGQPAWHGLGNKVPDNATGKEMLQIAGLDWTVQCRQLAMRDGTKAGRVIKDQLAGFRAIVRADTHDVFQVASDQYKPVQNKEIVEFFREFCEAGHATIETVGAMRNGAVIWALALLDHANLNIMGTDRMEGRLLLSTSHDGTIPTIAKATQVRVVCGNTHAAALSDGKPAYRLSHRTKFSKAHQDEAKRVMGMATAAVIRDNELAAKLANVKVDQSDWLEFMGKLLGKDAVLAKTKSVTGVPQMTGEDAIFWNEFVSGVEHGHIPEAAELSRVAADIQESTMTSPGSSLQSARGTMWGVVNGVTHYVDHKTRARSDSNRLFSAWFGDGERLKNDAVRIATEMAGITIPVLQSR